MCLVPCNTISYHFFRTNSKLASTIKRLVRTVLRITGLQKEVTKYMLNISSTLSSFAKPRLRVIDPRCRRQQRPVISTDNTIQAFITKPCYPNILSHMYSSNTVENKLKQITKHQFPVEYRLPWGWFMVWDLGISPVRPRATNNELFQALHNNLREIVESFLREMRLHCVAEKSLSYIRLLKLEGKQT